MTVPCAIGATARTPRNCSRNSAMSRMLNGLAVLLDRPGPNCPGRTNSTLVPSLAISAATFAVVPLPMVTMAITAATPMTMPSRVRNDRKALRRIACTASLRVS